jgi:hypothetical protein
MTKTAFKIIDVTNEMQEAKAFDFEHITKTSISNTAKAIASPILDGEMSPSKKMIHFMALRDILDEVISEIRPAAIDELKLSKGSNAQIFGAKIEPSVTAKYNYSACGDSEWDDLNKAIEITKAKLKEREAFLKTLKSPVYLPETGEEVRPAMVTGGETIRVTFAK